MPSGTASTHISPKYLNSAKLDRPSASQRMSQRETNPGSSPLALMRSPIHLTTGTTIELPRAFQRRASNTGLADGSKV